MTEENLDSICNNFEQTKTKLDATLSDVRELDYCYHDDNSCKYYRALPTTKVVGLCAYDNKEIDEYMGDWIRKKGVKNEKKDKLN